MKGLGSIASVLLHQRYEREMQQQCCADLAERQRSEIVRFQLRAKTGHGKPFTASECCNGCGAPRFGRCDYCGRGC